MEDVVVEDTKEPDLVRLVVTEAEAAKEEEEDAAFETSPPNKLTRMI